MPQLFIDVLSGKAAEVVAVEKGRALNPDGTSSRGPSGCGSCPLNTKPNLHKFIQISGGSPRGVIWAMAPDRLANQQQKPLAGKVGVQLFKDLRQYGLGREDFQIEYLVRCLPPSNKRDEHGNRIERLPTKQEFSACSYHTYRAQKQTKASAGVWLVLGAETAARLLRSEYRKTRPVFWSERHNVQVIVIADANRIPYLSSIPWRHKHYVSQLEAVAYYHKNPGRWRLFQDNDFTKVESHQDARRLFRVMRKVGRRRRISIDIEHGTVDGEQKLLTIAFSWRKGQAACLVLYHPENADPGAIESNMALLREFLEDPEVEKVFHYGSSDTLELRALAGIRVKGYNFDTTYAHYLKYTFLRKHGLEGIADEHFPLFAGYKDYIKPYYDPANANFAGIPLKRLWKYNCADALLTHTIEQETKDDVSLPLLKVYTWAGITLYKMERRGPYFDYQYSKDIVSVVPRRRAKVLQELRMIAENPEFNPNAPEDVAWLLYDKLKLPPADEQNPRGTKEETLNMLSAATGNSTPGKVLEFRGLSKMEGTYMRNYEESAAKHGGQLRAKWYLTGAVTGRLRCGGKKDGIDGTINFQNLHGSALMQNILVSDPDWRDVGLAKLPEPADAAAWEDFLERYGHIKVFHAYDYSQVEIRMLAEVSGDKLLLAQFKAASQMADPSDPRADIHCLVGNLLNPKWSLEFIKGDKPTRTFIKNCHFGMVYGLSEQGLYYYLIAKGVKTTQKKVSAFHKAYFLKYKGVANFIKRMRAQVEALGYVETIFGFVRRVDSDLDTDRTTNPANQAINSPIQGAAHQLLLNAMAMLHLYPKELKLLQDCIAEVHDALVFSCCLRDLPQAYALGKELLEKKSVDFARKVFGRELEVPLLSECTAGFRYGVQVEYAGEDLHTFLAKWQGKNTKVEATVAQEYGG